MFSLYYSTVMRISQKRFLKDQENVNVFKSFKITLDQVHFFLKHVPFGC